LPDEGRQVSVESKITTKILYASYMRGVRKLDKPGVRRSRAERATALIVCYGSEDTGSGIEAAVFF